jgi:hypothetical protein
MKRREFLMTVALTQATTKLQNSIDVKVMEVFAATSGPSALLIHHADEPARDAFGNWLRRNSGKLSCGRYETALQPQDILSSESVFWTQTDPV